ncbi:MAG: hypothetical protein ACYC56_05815 [Candidatus Aquicultor sp.]
MNRSHEVFLIIIVLVIGLAQPVLAVGTRQQQAVGVYRQTEQGFQDAVSRYNNARENYSLVKQELKQAKETYKPQLLDKAKQFVLQADSAAIRYLETIKNRVQMVQGITEENRAKALKEIDADIDWLNAIRPDIENTKNMTELRSTARMIRERWRQSRGISKRIAGKVLTMKISAIITRGEQASAKIGKRINELKAQGKDTANLERYHADLVKSLALAKERNEAAKSQFDDIQSLGDANLLYKDGMRSVKESHRQLKEAHSALIGVNQELAGVGGNR